MKKNERFMFNKSICSFDRIACANNFKNHVEEGIKGNVVGKGKMVDMYYHKVQKILIYLIYFLPLKKKLKQSLAKNIQRMVATASQQNVSLIICGTN